MTRRISKRKLILIGGMLLFAAILAIVSTMQAYKLSHNHAEMLSFIDSIQTAKYEQLNKSYSQGYEIYYALTSLSGIYAADSNDRYYDKMKMERWTVELFDDSIGIIILSVPEMTWNPKYVDLKKGGWQLSGEVGSSITLYHPKLNPDNTGRLNIEVIDRNPRGAVFLIGQPNQTQP